VTIIYFTMVTHFIITRGVRVKVAVI